MWKILKWFIKPLLNEDGWWIPLLGSAVSGLVGGLTTPKPSAQATQVQPFRQPRWYYPTLPGRQSYVTMTQPAADVAYQQMLARIGEATKQAMGQLGESYQKRGLLESGLLSEEQRKMQEAAQKDIAQQAANIYQWQTELEAQARRGEEAWRRDMAAVMAGAQMGLPAAQREAAQWAYQQQAPYQQVSWSGWQKAIPEALKAYQAEQQRKAEEAEYKAWQQQQKAGTATTMPYNIFQTLLRYLGG